MFRSRAAAVRLFLTVSLCCATFAAAQTSVSIHDIMTSLPNSPKLGQNVIANQGTPIVVGVVPGTVSGSNGGFYLTLQTWDNDVNTSEGIFVQGSSIAGCQVSVGQVVYVTGVVTNSTGANLTAADTPGTYLVPSACTANGTAAMNQGISLSGALATFGAALKYTGMAVTNPSFYAVEPTTGTTNSDGTAVTSTGQFWATLGSNSTTDNHLFRSAGIAGDEYVPSGAPSGVPTWSGNPQRVLIDTTTFGGKAVDITVGQTITCTNSGATVGSTKGIGVVDYTLGYARILIFNNVNCSVSGTVPTTVSAAADSTHFKVGTLDVNTFLGTPALFTTALSKATLAVTNVFGSPDIFALQQVGNQATLQYLADAANTANAGSTAFEALVPGADTATNLVHSGYLVNTNTLKNATATEVQTDTTYTFNGATKTLWDHPPVVLTGEFARVGKNYPVTVIDVDFLPRDNSGDATAGPAIRAQRAMQASQISLLVQQLQLQGANVIVAGNFNSYEYNDGYVDVVGVVTGSPAAAANVTNYVSSSTVDPLTDFTTQVTANSRYNIIERGNAASLEHILASSTVPDASTASASLASYINLVTQPHFTTDYAAVDANDATTPAALTPHDGFLVNFAIPPVPTTASLSPPSLSFGDVEIDGGTATLPLTFTNTTTYAATVTVSKIAFSGTNATEFTETDNCTSALPEGASCTIDVTFAPLAVGTRSATVTVTSDSTSNGTLTASLTGIGVDTTATLTPTSYTFPTTSLSATSTAELFTFTNTDKVVALTVGTPTVTGDYSITSNTCTAAIAAGGTCTVGVVFTPTAVGTRTGVLTVPNSSSGNPTLTATLSGNGLATTATLTPASATFANTYAGGGISAAQTFTFTNTSAIAIAFKTATVTTNFNVSANNCPSSVAAGGSCTVLVTFVPTAAGALTGTLTVTDGSSANPTLTATLNGTGLATTATLTPATQAFGNVVLGSTSASFPFVYTNTSAVALTVSAASVTGDFKVAGNGCTTVAAGASCTVGVVLTPTVLGARTGTLTVTSSATANPTLTATLTGRGVADVETSVSALDFGTVDVGAHSAAQVVTITNYTSAAISLTGLGLTGDYASTSTCGGILPGLSSCTVTIVFTPTTTGARPGTLTVTTSDTKYPVLSVALTGNGTDFSLTILPATGSMIAGNGTMTATVTATALGGFNAPVTLSCAFLAVASTCTLPNPSFTLSGTTTQTMAMTTTGQYTLVGYGLHGPMHGFALVPATLGLCAATLVFAVRRRFRLPSTLLLAFLALLLGAGGLTGCSSKYPSLNSPYTEPGTYVYTVTATDGTITHTATYTLTVRQRN